MSIFLKSTVLLLSCPVNVRKLPMKIWHFKLLLVEWQTWLFKSRKFQDTDLRTRLLENESERHEVFLYGINEILVTRDWMILTLISWLQWEKTAQIPFFLFIFVYILITAIVTRGEGKKYQEWHLLF